jgi:hypothetical protein
MGCLLYCHCAHAKVVPDATRQAVLGALAATGRPFEAVADLCEMSARKDPTLARLVAQPGLQLVACHRRAVAWLLNAAGTALPPETVVHNMRESPPEKIIADLGLPAASAPPPPGATP